MPVRQPRDAPSHSRAPSAHPAHDAPPLPGQKYKPDQRESLRDIAAQAYGDPILAPILARSLGVSVNKVFRKGTSLTLPTLAALLSCDKPGKATLPRTSTEDRFVDTPRASSEAPSTNPVPGLPPALPGATLKTSQPRSLVPPLTAPVATESLLPSPASRLSETEKIQLKAVENLLHHAHPRDVHGLEHLYEMVEQLESHALVEAAHTQLREAFRKLWLDTSPAAWVHRSDLADCVDLLVQKSTDSHSALPHLRLADMPQRAPNDHSNDVVVPLVAYRKISEANLILNDPQSALPTTAHEVLSTLGDAGRAEVSGTAKVVNILTRRARYQRGFIASIITLFKRLVTSGMGRRMKRVSSVKRIASNSIKLGIAPTETITHLTYHEGRPYEHEVLLGPRFLFGKSPHEFSSVNQWFVRDWTPTARQEYSFQTVAIQARLRARFGKAPTGVLTSLVVGANSNSRVRVAQLEPRAFGEEQVLTGKVLSRNAAKELKRRGDSPAYPTGHYTFTTRNLLGRSNNVSMDPNLSSLLHPTDESQWVTATRRLEALQKLSSSLGNGGPHALTLAHRIKGLTNHLKKRQNRVVAPAQHELLSACFRAFDRTGAVQVIQRLAPADIHNYVAPLNGRPLSHTEAVRVLKRRVEERRWLIAGQHNNAPDSYPEFAALTREAADLDRLVHIFEGQEAVLGRPSQPTIDITGNLHESVSTPAVLNQPRILAQNDRKVMLFEHEDGSISLHTFIGATGVNRVDVDPTNGNKPMVAGERIGDMSFGVDTYNLDPDELQVEASNTSTRDGTGKLKLLKSKVRGEALGTFPINGSTVISYYLPGDFSPLDHVDAFTDAAHYLKNGQRRIDVEILCRMGAPLLMKTEVRAVEALERLYPEILSTCDDKKDPASAVLDWIANDDFKPLNSQGHRDADTEVLEYVQSYLRCPESKLMPDGKRLKNSLLTALKGRFSRRQEFSRIAKLYQDYAAEEGIEDLKTVPFERIKGFEAYLLTLDRATLSDYTRQVCSWLRAQSHSSRSFRINTEVARFESELITTVQTIPEVTEP